jgi:hypothetical protein
MHLEQIQLLKNIFGLSSIKSMMRNPWIQRANCNYYLRIIVRPMKFNIRKMPRIRV